MRRDGRRDAEVDDWDLREALAGSEQAPRDFLAQANEGASSTHEQNAVWRELYRRQWPQVEKWASDLYLEGAAILQLATDRVPRLDEIDRVILPRTGWKTRRTTVRYSDAVPWYRHFARREFLVTDFMRSRDELEFTPEPDMFHDIFGHLPFLTLPRYTEILEMFAPAFLRADEAAREDIKRLAWFSTEFGLLRENGERKALGAGLLSSMEELASVMRGGVEIRPFTVENVLERDKAVWSHNEVLFEIESLEALAEELEGYFPRL